MSFPHIPVLWHGLPVEPPLYVLHGDVAAEEGGPVHGGQEELRGGGGAWKKKYGVYFAKNIRYVELLQRKARFLGSFSLIRDIFFLLSSRIRHV